MTATSSRNSQGLALMPGRRRLAFTLGIAAIPGLVLSLPSQTSAIIAVGRGMLFSPWIGLAARCCR